MAYVNLEDQRRASRVHYERNREKVKARALVGKREGRDRNAEYVRDYLQSHPCVDCGTSDVRVLEFDHREPSRKAANVSALARESVSIGRLREEMDKCDVRCANCHRIKTRERIERGRPTARSRRSPPSMF